MLIVVVTSAVIVRIVFHSYGSDPEYAGPLKIPYSRVPPIVPESLTTVTVSVISPLFVRMGEDVKTESAAVVCSLAYLYSPAAESASNSIKVG